MISRGYLSLPQPLPEGEEFPDRHYLHLQLSVISELLIH
jgi:hypothetical protein